VVAVVASILVALTSGAMPDAPTRVKYTTAKGDVTFDHAAHVARRETCRSCHTDAGPVRKIELGNKKAHVLCVGCHLGRKAGPKACTQCHDNT
jgi:predicted CXXCH cytochrome family protein